jgi:hypothetical protein
MGIEIWAGRKITDAADKYPDAGPAVYEVLPPLTIEEVFRYSGDTDMYAEWELSGQITPDLPWEDEEKFKFFSDGAFGFYQKIVQ